MESSIIDNPAPTILIVDDQIDNIQVLAIALEMQGYSITYALSGIETFQRLNAIKPDIILLDLFMPGMDGLQVCEQLKADANYQDIPILFLTASHDEDHIINAFEKGAADYVTKPFRTIELFARVKTHIQLRRQALEIDRNRNKLETIVNHIQDGILLVDRNGVIKFANSTSAQMFDKTLSSLVGSQIGIPIVDRRITQINIIKPNGELGQAEITVAQTEWDDEPASIICLRDVSDLDLRRSHGISNHRDTENTEE
ncbi:MAG: response regulator [Sphaerospermopsis sp. SIO1G1]|nr:response regulator [Sphaerospermopsis sp. SIO1G1]